VRAITVSRSTLTTYQRPGLRRLMPTHMHAMQVNAVTEREVARSYEQLLADGLSELSVIRYRASLSSFFAWCVRERIIRANPVTSVKVPRSSAERVEMMPWTEDELNECHAAWAAEEPRLADIFLLLGWTGLRWAEVRALLVRDVVELPTPGLQVRRSTPEGHETKATKGRRSRRVPLADRVLPIVRELAAGKEPDALLVTTTAGATLHRTAVVRTLHWDHTGQGRRIHDLRHTAACLWLARGVDPGTVRAWMGHESIATTDIYLHNLGTGADTAGLSRLNQPSPPITVPASHVDLSEHRFRGGRSPDGDESPRLQKPGTTRADRQLTAPGGLAPRRPVPLTRHECDGCGHRSGSRP
jgi:integrase